MTFYVKFYLNRFYLEHVDKQNDKDNDTQIMGQETLLNIILEVI